MFKATIFRKMFLILVFGMLMIAGTILLSVHWSFSQGFGVYLLQAEAAQLDKLVQMLEQTYAKEGNWSRLQGQRGAWFDILRQALEEHHLPPHALLDQVDMPAPPRPFPLDMPPPHDQPLDFISGPPPPMGEGPDGRQPPWQQHGAEHGPPEMLAKFLGSRLQLLDVEKHKVVGLANGLQQALLRPIQRDGKVVGWLALLPSDLINDHLAQLFVAQQIRNNYQIAVLAVLLAILGAIAVSRKLLTPIQRLAGGAKALVAGDYTTQIPVSSGDELGQLAQDFNVLATTLARNEQVRKHWIADISHELRTPLAILRGEIEAVQDGIRDFSQDSLHSLHVEVINLTRLVDDLYELSLSDLGAEQYHKTLVDINGSLADVVRSVSPRFADSELTLSFQQDASTPSYMQADARRMRQLWINLLENSRRYSVPGGFCEITVQATATNMTVTFQDTPPGVPDWALSKLFDRLYRVDKSRNRELGGAGLGLAICKAIVTAHQGDIRAFPSKHGGLGIAITLPLQPQPSRQT